LPAAPSGAADSSAPDTMNSNATNPEKTDPEKTDPDRAAAHGRVPGVARAGRAAVTGGTGLIGAALIDLLLAGGWRVTALARNPGGLARAGEMRPGDLRVVKGDLASDEALADLAAGADAFFHLAGVTHAREAAAYRAANVEGAANVARAAAAAGAAFIHISSLSARAPWTSAYADSKAESEAAVRAASGENPWRALRLPAIYGPGDHATLPYFKLVRAGFALEPRTEPPAQASLLFVADAAAAAVAALDAPAGAVYEVGDESPGGGRPWREIGRCLGEVMGSAPRPLRVPRPVVSALHGATIAIERITGKRPSVRPGQAREFFHPDWVARERLLSQACGWTPATPLKEGFAKTVLWYQENGLL